MYRNFLVFGTSTTYGCWDSEGGWVTRLRNFVDQQIIESNFEKSNFVYNLGISCDKTSNILGRFDNESRARMGHNRKREIIIIFHTLINDTICNTDSGELEVTEAEFKKNLKELFSKAKKISDTIIAIGSVPVDKRVDPMPWAPGRSYRNEYVKRYNELLEQTAREEKVHFIEVFKKLINTDYSSLLADGVHMNDDGHKKLYEMVKNFLVKEKLI